MSEHQTLSRSTRSQRRKTKNSAPKDTTNKILNFLIALVGLLIIVSLVLILTNDNVKTDIKSADGKNEPATNNPITNEPTSSKGSASTIIDNESTDEETNGTENNAEATSEDEPVDLSHITFLTSADPNVIQSWTNAKWVPYPTEQTGEHRSMFDAEHIDYQEKIKLIYRDTSFNETDSILWNIKNVNGDAVAVLSTLNKKEIYRLTMKWVINEGWQTVLIEQLQSLEGAY